MVQVNVKPEGGMMAKRKSSLGRFRLQLGMNLGPVSPASWGRRMAAEGGSAGSEGVNK
jgi:hypothetical protein